MSLAMRPLNQEALAPIVHVLSIFPGVNAKVHRNHWPHAKLAVAPLAIGAQQASVAETDVEQDDVARRKPGRTDNLLGWRRLSLESAAIQCAGPVAAQDELSDAAPVAHVDKRDVTTTAYGSNNRANSGSSGASRCHAWFMLFSIGAVAGFAISAPQCVS
eukprot:CAMPEP_0204169962 /NCGR_PEP_ID=MMETSP0361-20130328/41988_1 /ASSEMBLY_ACC=CAM_ASM_000343 /TAXON_ID=268821 /ORGANISM="Scrippsiella Hangoei, Strain SHTV-5" /LENGTH=159 /DNA_ID=CAMNT_0051127623 /DNA_START=381 /DNA_END=858 /DNA_ORIENTATION=-